MNKINKFKIKEIWLLKLNYDRLKNLKFKETAMQESKLIIMTQLISKNKSKVFMQMNFISMIATTALKI